MPLYCVDLVLAHQKKMKKKTRDSPIRYLGAQVRPHATPWMLLYCVDLVLKKKKKTPILRDCPIRYLGAQVRPHATPWMLLYCVDLVLKKKKKKPDSQGFSYPVYRCTG